jgi:hypothetical protein
MITAAQVYLNNLRVGDPLIINEITDHLCRRSRCICLKPPRVSIAAFFGPAKPPDRQIPPSMVSHEVIHHLKTSFSGRWPSHGQRHHLRCGRDHPIIRPIIGDQVYRDQARHGIERPKPTLPEVS